MGLQGGDAVDDHRHLPFPAGQGTDVATRHLAEQLTRTLGQNFYVENRPGTNRGIGMNPVAK